MPKFQVLSPRSNSNREQVQPASSSELSPDRSISRPHLVSSSEAQFRSTTEIPSIGRSSSRPLNPREAASFLGLDDKTITRWARQGYLPAHPMGQGKKKYWRFFEHELLDWLLGQSEVAA